MKQKILSIIFPVVFSFLIFISCTSELDNTAASSDGVKIVFDNKGEGEPALLFIHGWSNNKSIWDAQVELFSKKYKTIAVDLAGFGESGNNRTDWTIQQFGSDVAAVVNKLDLEQVVLVGFSMGGPVAVEAANKLPDKVIGVVLVDDLHNVEMKFPPQMISYMDSVMMDLVSNPTREKLVQGGFVKKNTDEKFKLVLSMLKDNQKIGWEESLINTLRWQNENCIESISKIKVPVIAINSDRMPTNVEAFKKYVPSFEVKIIPNVGHVVFWDEPEKFNNLLEESMQEFVSR